MYAGLDLAEQVRCGRLEDLEEGKRQPYIERRGLKFNIPLDQRVRSYDDSGTAARENIRTVWELDFWKEYFDDLARYRYNVVSLWNRHPFPALVKLPDYPDAACPDVMDYDGLVKKMSMDEKIAFWRQVMQYASDRCIDVCFITWNVHLGTAEGKYGLTEAQDNRKTIAYMQACVKAMFETYPLLAGIGTTAGEAMENRTDEFSKESWVWQSYGQPVLEIANQQPARKILFIHRYWVTDFSDILKRFQPLIDRPNVTFDISFKYARAHIYSDPAPVFARKEVLPILTSTLRCWWNLRNDDIYTFRWGDPDYVRAFVLNLPPRNQTAGYYMGSDRYAWAREVISKEPENPRQIQTQWNAYKFLLWGKLSYDPNLPNERFVDYLRDRYPGTDSATLFSAWQFASKILPLVTKFHWESWDFEWSPETCSGFYHYSHSTPHWHNVQDFIDATPMDNSNMIGIANYARAVVKGRTVQEVSPVDVAGQLRTYAQEALKKAGKIHLGNSKELAYVKGDIEAMAHLGNYYADKIAGATCHAIYTKGGRGESNRELAIQHLLRAYGHWMKCAEVYSSLYKPQFLASVKMWTDYYAYRPYLDDDIRFVGGDPQTADAIISEDHP